MPDETNAKIKELLVVRQSDKDVEHVALASSEQRSRRAASHLARRAQAVTSAAGSEHPQSSGTPASSAASPPSLHDSRLVPAAGMCAHKLLTRSGC